MTYADAIEAVAVGSLSNHRCLITHLSKEVLAKSSAVVDDTIKDIGRETTVVISSIASLLADNDVWQVTLVHEVVFSVRRTLEASQIGQSKVTKLGQLVFGQILEIFVNTLLGRSVSVGENR